MSFSYQFLTVINLAFEIYVWLIIIRVFFSFMQPRRYSRWLEFIYQVTEPVLAFCRRLLPNPIGGLDFSPFLAIIGMELVKSVFLYLLNLLLRSIGG